MGRLSSPATWLGMEVVCSRVRTTCWNIDDFNSTLFVGKSRRGSTGPPVAISAAGRDEGDPDKQCATIHCGVATSVNSYQFKVAGADGKRKELDK